MVRLFHNCILKLTVMYLRAWEKPHPVEKTFLSYRNLIWVPVCFAAFRGNCVSVSSVVGFPC